MQGAQVVKEQVTEALLIFVIPPSLETLFARLRTRATETADELELRQANAAIELARQEDYDHVVNETGEVETTRPGSRRSSPTSTADTRGAGSGSRWSSSSVSRPRPRKRTSAGTGRYVEVAIDAAGAGGMRTYTYAVPTSFVDVEAGEAVIVEFGRRQALAVVLGDATEPQGIEAKPLAARVRADGPLPPPLSSRSRAGSPAIISSRRPWSSGRCSRHGCSNGSSWSSSGLRQAPVHRPAAWT